MKCIVSKSGKTIERVKDDDARKKVATGNWNYINKEAWKERVRGKSTKNVEVAPEAKAEDKGHGLKAKERKKLSKK